MYFTNFFIPMSFSQTAEPLEMMNDKLTFKKYSNREFFNIRENTKGYIYINGLK